MPTVVSISIAPVKGLALVSPDAVQLELTGVADDRRFYLVDANGRLRNQKRSGELTLVRPEPWDGELVLRFPGGELVSGEPRLGQAVTTSFYGRDVSGRVVEGPWSEALSSYAGESLTLVRTEREGDGVDRGRGAGATLVSTESLRVLAKAAGVAELDGRRFRMLFTVDGLEPHGEDAWLGRRVRVGGAVVEVAGNVGRCVITSRDPATGKRDIPTLDLIQAYRGELATTEPLPFGVWATVVEPGRVAVGDPVEPG